MASLVKLYRDVKWLEGGSMESEPGFLVALSLYLATNMAPN